MKNKNKERPQKSIYPIKEQCHSKELIEKMTAHLPIPAYPTKELWFYARERIQIYAESKTLDKVRL